METLDIAEAAGNCFMDNFLDFSSNIGKENENKMDPPNNKPRGKSLPSCAPVSLNILEPHHLKPFIPGLLVGVSGHFNYKDTLTKSLIFLEPKRLGMLHPNNKLLWRGDSPFDNGKLANAHLVEGYYNVRDNVKYRLPLAFTITISWGTLFYDKELRATGKLENTQTVIKWATGYLLKTSCKHHRLYVQLGDLVAYNKCWVRLKDMHTSRIVLMIDEKQPRTEIAAKTSAVMASSSIIFRHCNHTYARSLLNKVKLVHYLFLSLALPHDGS